MQSVTSNKQQAVTCGREESPARLCALDHFAITHRGHKRTQGKYANGFRTDHRFRNKAKQSLKKKHTKNDREKVITASNTFRPNYKAHKDNSTCLCVYFLFQWTAVLFNSLFLIGHTTVTSLYTNCQPLQFIVQACYSLTLQMECFTNP